MTENGRYRPKLGAFSRRPSGSERVRKARLVTLVVALGLLAELAYLTFHSPRLAVTGVVFRGDERVAAEVASRLKLARNTNIFLAPTGRLRREAERVPAVRAATVSRDWRRHLVVTLERREAMAVIRGEKRAVLVDPTGVVFSIRNEWGWGLPELVAPHLSKGDTGSREAKAELATLLSALRALGPDPRLRISRLELDKVGRIEAGLDAGAKVRLGTADQLAAKTKLLTTVIEQLGADQIAFLDLSDPWAAYWRPKGAAESVKEKVPQHGDGTQRQ